MPYSLKPPPPPDSARGSLWPLLAMIAATALCLAGAVVGVPAAIVSPVLFDHPTAKFNPAVWLGFGLTIGFWAVCLLAPFAAWVWWSRGQPPRAWACMAAPLAWGVATVAVVQLL